MSIIKCYSLDASDGTETALQEILSRLAAHVEALEGCERVTLLRDVNEPGRFMFLETYVDASAYAASAANVPKSLLAEMMKMLRAKPEVRTLTPTIDT